MKKNSWENTTKFSIRFWSFAVFIYV